MNVHSGTSYKHGEKCMDVFSPKVIKDSIREGELKTKQILDQIAKNM